MVKSVVGRWSLVVGKDLEPQSSLSGAKCAKSAVTFHAGSLASLESTRGLRDDAILNASRFVMTPFSIWHGAAGFCTNNYRRALCQANNSAVPISIRPRHRPTQIPTAPHPRLKHRK
jgi:hypothetical protein